MFVTRITIWSHSKGPLDTGPKLNAGQPSQKMCMLMEEGSTDAGICLAGAAAGKPGKSLLQFLVFLAVMELSIQTVQHFDDHIVDLLGRVIHKLDSPRRTVLGAFPPCQWRRDYFGKIHIACLALRPVKLENAEILVEP